MDMTKGLPCPCCENRARFQGGTFGAGLNTTYIVCDCGFSAWVILTRDDTEYHVMGELKDKIKANPYKEKDKDILIIERHYLNQALDKTSNRRVIDTLSHALRYIDDILKE